MHRLGTPVRGPRRALARDADEFRVTVRIMTMDPSFRAAVLAGVLEQAVVAALAEDLTRGRPLPEIRELADWWWAA